MTSTHLWIHSSHNPSPAPGRCPRDERAGALVRPPRGGAGACLPLGCALGAAVGAPGARPGAGAQRALVAPAGARRQGPAVRLPHVRPVRAGPHRHGLPDELRQAAAQRPLRRRARRRRLRGEAADALRVAGSRRRPAPRRLGGRALAGAAGPAPQRAFDLDPGDPAGAGCGPGDAAAPPDIPPDSRPKARRSSPSARSTRPCRTRCAARGSP
jgi:hypothetical protein